VTDECGVLGFAGVLRAGGVAHLADLFVRREARGGGAGRELLAAALPQEGTRTVFASGDERALPLYVRFGLRPIAPLLYLEGAPTVPPGAGAGRRVDVPRLLERDAAASGRERARELEFLAQAGAWGLAGERRGAYAVVRPTGSGAWIGPAWGGATDLLGFVAAAAAEHGAVKLALPGPHPALELLLRAGLRIVARDTYMASQLDALDVERYVPSVELG
jgi:hypothetical protein